MEKAVQFCFRLGLQHAVTGESPGSAEGTARMIEAIVIPTPITLFGYPPYSAGTATVQHFIVESLPDDTLAVSSKQIDRSGTIPLKLYGTVD